MDTDGLRRFVLQSIVEAHEVTVITLYAMVNESSWSLRGLWRR
jgi:hypothetical protein